MGKRSRRTFKWKNWSKLAVKSIKLMFRALPLLLIVSFLSLGFVGISQMLHKDPYFRVSKVTVFPSGILSDEEYDYLEQVTRGKSVFDLDLKAISANLRRNSQIKAAEVVRILPNRMKIILTTRAPLFQVQFQPKGAYYVVGGDQLVLSIKGDPAPQLIVIEDYENNRKNFSVGSLYHSSYAPRIREVLQWIDSDVFWKDNPVSRISVDQLGNFSLRLIDGVELIIGKRPLISESKRSALKQLLASKGRQGLSYVDLRFNDLVVKPRV